MDKEEALVICFNNLKGTKHKDVLVTAKALSFLKSLPEFGSNANVGAAVGVSGEIVREFLTILRLPIEVQEVIYSLEHGRRLWQLAKQRPQVLQETAHSIADLPTHDARHIVDYLLRNPESTVSQAKEAVLAARPIVERTFHIVAVLPEEMYRHLVIEARRHDQLISSLVTKIVIDWLDAR